MENGVYKELDEFTSEIRLLFLQPASSQDLPLEGKLQKYMLADVPPYECLSYAWGNPEYKHSIAIDDNELPITSNLDTALRHIRLTDVERILWVDAVCINQSSTSERSHQVSLMRAIYSQCTRDLLWLGPQPNAPIRYTAGAENPIQEGLQCMQKIADKAAASIEPMVEAWNSEVEKRGRWITKTYGVRGLPDEPRMLMGHTESYSLQSTFVNPPAWNRLWIMQELSLAPKILLVAGHETLDWQVVSDFLGDSPYADAFHGNFGHGMIQPIARRIFNKVQAIDHQRRILGEVRAGTGESKLLDVLARFRSTQASDPRDKVFGVLGLTTDTLDIQADYGKAPEEVYAEVTALLINHAANLDIICQSPWQSFGTESATETDSLQNRLPSWTANFMVNGETLLFAQRDIFNAGRVNCKTPCEFVDNGGGLRARGVIIGQMGPIRQADYMPDAKDASDARVRRWRKRKTLPRRWMKDYPVLDGMVSKQVPEYTYITGEPACTAFWRTLITDCRGYPMRRLTEDEIQKADARARKGLFQEIVDYNEDDKEGTEDWFEDREMMNLWTRTCEQWTFCMTTNGLFTIVLPPTQEGDLIACVDGAKVPLVLRRINGEAGDERYKLVTVAYVHGFMDGEATSSEVMRTELGLEDQDLVFV